MTKREIDRVFRKCHFFIDMFGINAYFTTSREEYAAMIDHIGGEPITNVGGRTEMHERVDGSVILFIAVFGEFSESALAHECTHGALFIANAIGHTLRPDCEVIPYMVGYLYDQCKAKL